MEKSDAQFDDFETISSILLRDGLQEGATYPDSRFRLANNSRASAARHSAVGTICRSIGNESGATLPGLALTISVMSMRAVACHAQEATADVAKVGGIVESRVL